MSKERTTAEIFNSFIKEVKDMLGDETMIFVLRAESGFQIAPIFTSLTLLLVYQIIDQTLRATKNT